MAFFFPIAASGLPHFGRRNLPHQLPLQSKKCRNRSAFLPSLSFSLCFVSFFVFNLYFISVCLSVCFCLCYNVCLYVSDCRSRLYLLLTMSLYMSYSVCLYALQAVFLLFLSLIHLVNNSKHESVSRTYITQSFILGTKDSVFYPVYQTNSAFRNQSFLGQRQLYSHGHAALIFLVRMQINFFSISFIHIYI